MKATMIDDRDNVAVVLGDVKAGDTITVTKNNETRSIIAVSDIPRYHKTSIKLIPAQSPVVKYGEHIGLAAEDIQPGTHVHVHNVLSNREDL
ncbi:MAG: UxaA family hydrolase [Lachnospiraceae bacterium]|nr:UxaA family hydrolase [Lachnospiraceae bacterium]